MYIGTFDDDGLNFKKTGDPLGDVLLSFGFVHGDARENGRDGNDNGLFSSYRRFQHSVALLELHRVQVKALEFD